MACLRLCLWSSSLSSLMPLVSHAAPWGLNIIYRLTTLKFLCPAYTSFPESRLVHPIAYSISLLGYHKPNIFSYSLNQSLPWWSMALEEFSCSGPKLWSHIPHLKHQEIVLVLTSKYIQNPKISPHLYCCCPDTSHNCFSTSISAITLNRSPCPCPSRSMFFSQQRCQRNSAKM